MNVFLWCMVAFVCFSTILFLICYRRRLSWWFLNQTPQTRIQSYDLHRFAVVIPARNEGATILPLIESLIKQNYSHDLFDVYIVVKETNDPTIELVHEIFPQAVFYVDEEQTNKGHALDYGMKEILKGKIAYDGFIIIDADCVLDSLFLCEMNRAFGSKKQVYNSKLVVKNYLSQNSSDNSWASYCNGLIWTLMSELGNRAKSDQGIVTMTLGTGLLIDAKLIQEWNGWPFQKTLTEDMELQRYCALHHYKTEYVSYAVCYVEESTSLTATNFRRNRWMTGVVHCDRLFDQQMKQEMKTKEDKLNFYAVHSLYYVYSYVGSLCVTFLASFLSAIVLSCLKRPAIGFYLLAFFCFFLFYLGLFIMTLRCMQVDKKYLPMKRKTRLWILFTHPFYYMGYVGIMIKIFTFRKTKTWKKIKRVEFQENAFKQV